MLGIEQRASLSPFIIDKLIQILLVEVVLDL